MSHQWIQTGSRKYDAEGEHSVGLRDHCGPGDVDGTKPGRPQQRRTDADQRR
jgi:hypothetical protein